MEKSCQPDKIIFAPLADHDPHQSQMTVMVTPGLKGISI